MRSNETTNFPVARCHPCPAADRLCCAAHCTQVAVQLTAAATAAPVATEAMVVTEAPQITEAPAAVPTEPVDLNVFAAASLTEPFWRARQDLRGCPSGSDGGVQLRWLTAACPGRSTKAHRRMCLPALIRSKWALLSMLEGHQRDGADLRQEQAGGDLPERQPGRLEGIERPGQAWLEAGISS